MSKQKYNLGDKIWCFRQQGDGFVKTSGVVKMAEINSAGYIQYQIECVFLSPTGEETTKNLTTNHASMALSETEIDIKIKKYDDWAQASKKDFEANFGSPEFAPDYLLNSARELAQNRG